MLPGFSGPQLTYIKALLTWRAGRELELNAAQKIRLLLDRAYPCKTLDLVQAGFSNWVERVALPAGWELAGCIVPPATGGPAPGERAATAPNGEE